MLNHQLSVDLQREHDLTLADYEILVQLSEHPERRLRMSELADATLASRSRLTHQVDRLVKRGYVERKKIGKKKWIKRVREAIEYFDEMIVFDHLYVGGGNAKHLDPADVGPKGRLISNSAGVIGGVRLWDITAASVHHN